MKVIDHLLRLENASDSQSSVEKIWIKLIAVCSACLNTMNWIRSGWMDCNLQRLLVQSELILHVNDGHSNFEKKTRSFVFAWSRTAVEKNPTHHSSPRCFYRHGAGWDRHTVAMIESDDGDRDAASARRMLERLQWWTIDHKMWTIATMFFVSIETVVSEMKTIRIFQSISEKNHQLTSLLARLDCEDITEALSSLGVEYPRLEVKSVCWSSNEDNWEFTEPRLICWRKTIEWEEWNPW